MTTRSDTSGPKERRPNRVARYFARFDDGELVRWAFRGLLVGAVAVLVLDAQPWQMGVLGASGSAAVLLLGLSAGVIADRLPRIPLMHGMNLIRLLLVLSIPIAYFAGVLTIAQLAIVVFLLGAATVIFDSCISSVIPVLVERRSLPKANSWMQASVSTSDLFGASVAGGTRPAHGRSGRRSRWTRH
jgi:hypothetical protein